MEDILKLYILSHLAARWEEMSSGACSHHYAWLDWWSFHLWRWPLAPLLDLEHEWLHPTFWSTEGCWWPSQLARDQTCASIGGQHDDQRDEMNLMGQWWYLEHGEDHKEKAIGVRRHCIFLAACSRNRTSCGAYSKLGSYPTVRNLFPNLLHYCYPLYFYLYAYADGSDWCTELRVVFWLLRPSQLRLCMYLFELSTISFISHSPFLIQNTCFSAELILSDVESRTKQIRWVHLAICWAVC